jgi:hypothetical protein
MKQCPTCGTSYNDPNLSFCLADGSQLIANVDEQATFVRPGSEPLRVQIPQDPAPVPQYIAAAQPKASSGGLAKILLAVVALGVLLVLVVGVVGAVAYFSYFGKETASNTGSPSPPKTASPVPTQSASPSPSPSPTLTPTPTPTPTIDKAALTKELVGREREIVKAALKGNVATLAENLTDDFKSTDVSGRVLNKKALLDESRNSKEDDTTTFSVDKPELVSGDENTAVLRYILTISPEYSEPDRVRVTETYVRQNGRWMLKSQKTAAIQTKDP